MIRDEIIKEVAGFTSICKIHGIKRLYAFGSAITSDFNHQTSDIDLLVEIDEPDPIERGEKLISLWNTFEDFFQRKVDLLTDSSVSNPYLRKQIDDTKVLIYDREKPQVLI